jgi:hypothetical protein
MDRADLNYQMTTMFIQRLIKNFQMVKASEYELRSYLDKVFHFCQNACVENNFELTTVAAQDGWLVLRDSDGTEHQVPYRWVWTIENLKDYIKIKHSSTPERQDLNVSVKSFASHSL